MKWEMHREFWLYLGNFDLFQYGMRGRKSFAAHALFNRLHVVLHPYKHF